VRCRGVADRGDPMSVPLRGLPRYYAFQDNLIGPDPMADGAQDWPAWNDLPNTLSPLRPLTGWRYWAVVTTDGGLVAPFSTKVIWSPGINRSSSLACQVRHGRHPMPSTRENPCRCGIRVMQSLTVLRAFAARQGQGKIGIGKPRIGPLAAYAEVNVWGRVAPFAPEDDWQYTLRAEFAEIVSLHLAPTHAMHAEALAERYGIEVQLTKPKTRKASEPSDNYESEH